VGHYRSFNPWLTNFFFVVRDGAPALLWPRSNTERSLEPAGEGYFRLVDQPENLRFGPVVDGEALSVRFSGGVYFRVEL
jgi:hypothetical protein